MKKMTKMAIMTYLIIGFCFSTAAMNVADSLIVTNPGSSENVVKYLISSMVAIIATCLVTFVKTLAENLTKKDGKLRKL